MIRINPWIAFFIIVIFAYVAGAIYSYFILIDTLATHNESLNITENLTNDNENTSIDIPCLGFLNSINHWWEAAASKIRR